MPNLFSFLRGKRHSRASFKTVLVCLDHDKFDSNVDTNELTALDPLHYSSVDVNGCLFGPPFPVVNDQLLGLAHVEREVVVLASLVAT